LKKKKNTGNKSTTSGSNNFHWISRQDEDRKKIVNTAVFFTILYWLSVYFLAIKNKILVKELSAPALAVIILINLVIILCSRYLQPVFAVVLKVTQKIGTLIFAVITTLVYIFILTPIAFYKRLTRQKLLDAKIEKDKETYYEDWEPSENIEKQY